MELVLVSENNGRWAALTEQWRKRCEAFGDDPSAFETAAFNEVLGKTAAGDGILVQGQTRAAVYALANEGEFHAICWLNSAPLPGTEGVTLRLRHLTVSPDYDYGEYDLDAYAAILGELFAEIVELSQADMPAKHIKMYLPSPADRIFFASLSEVVATLGTFVKVESKGTWFYVTKR